MRLSTARIDDRTPAPWSGLVSRAVRRDTQGAGCGLSDPLARHRRWGRWHPLGIRWTQCRRQVGDHGFSMVEVLVTIVLLGLGAAGTLGAMFASVDGSVESRDLANAQTWLQGAADYLQGQPRQDCDNVNGVPGEAEARIRGIYQGDVQMVANPAGWPAADITVLQPVLFWDGDQYQSVCHDNDGINLQLVTLQVRSPSGKVVHTLQVVRGA